MNRYKYDIRLGHYIPLFEGEAPIQADGDTTQTTEVEVPKQAALVNLDNDDVVQLKNEKAKKLESIQKTIDDKESNVIQMQKQIADTANAGNADQAALNKLQATMLQALKEVADAKFEYAKVTNDMDNRIFQVQKKLVESRQIAFDRQSLLPNKYRSLNESNIQNAKIHFSILFNNDYTQKIKGMVDFKKAFKDSNLLYGKDKEGFFAVCVDQADFNKLTKVLEDIGYDRDDILSVILPQLFDRSNLTK